MSETKTPPQYPLFAAANGDKPEVVAPVVAAPGEHTQPATPPEENKTPAEAAAPQAPSTPAVTPPAEPTDDEILAIFNKRNGTEFKSLDEIVPKKAKSKEEAAAEEEKFRADALEWALGTGKLGRDKYEKSIIDKSRTPREIALAAFTANLREEDKDITNEEAEEIFKDTYHEDKEVDNPRLYRLGQKRMADEAAQYLKANYGDVDGLEDSFREYIDGSEKFKSFNKQVKTFFGAVPTDNSLEVEYTHANGKTEKLKIDYKVSEEDVKAIQKQFANEEMFFALGADKGEVSEKTMNDAFKFHLKARVFDKALADVAVRSADLAAVETMAYLKGIKVDQPGSLPGSSTVSTAAPKEPPKYPLRDEAMKKQGLIK